MLNGIKTTRQQTIILALFPFPPIGIVTVKLIWPFWGKGPATVYQPPIRELLLLSKPIRFG